MSEDLQRMFVEDAPQQVNELNNAETLSSHVLKLQALEDEIKLAILKKATIFQKEITKKKVKEYRKKNPPKLMDSQKTD